MRILAPSFVKLLSTPTAKERKRILASMSGGPFTSKTTRPDRFLDLDAAILLAARRLPMDKEITVHDMAASDGITSLDLFNRLSRERPVRLTASDYYNEISAAPRGIFWVFYDSDHVLLQVALGAIALTNKPANEFLAWLLSPSLARATSVSLFHPEVIAKTKTDGRFMATRDDFFSPSPGRYDVVRVMNALGARNFPRLQIERALRAVTKTVADGGLLVLGRSADELDGSPQATIFQRLRHEFIAVTDMAGGYELRDFVLKLRADM
ncbi:hypothetical protein CK228_24700 [Mesorhizobium sp. WSM4312]|nr:hypothetical protein CK228_24700 [Mesorhizobium sp. WSM4312]PBC20068.1 hypothetical protein CK226_25155 [Mesorhizobium sp. WSM4311]